MGIVKKPQRYLPIGHKAGHLTVLGAQFRIPVGSQMVTMVVCECECGNVTVVQSRYLFPQHQPHTGSCGCLKNVTHGMGAKGERRHRLYRIWSGIIQRCTNPRNSAFKDYGGRGISVCAEWKSFDEFRHWAFSAGYEDTLTIERCNNDEGYSPSNCCWATRREQARNRRRNRYIEAFGERKIVADWSTDPRCKVDVTTIYNRLRRGISGEHLFQGGQIRNAANC